MKGVVNPEIENVDQKESIGGSSLVLEGLGLLPGVVGVTEVTVRSGPQVLRLLEVELLDCKS